MKKKPGLTIEQHDRIGLELQTMRDSLLYLSSIIGAAYPRKEKVYKLSTKARDLLDEFRSALDDRAFVDHRELTDMTVINKLYYRAGRPDYREPEALATILSEVRSMRGR